MSREAQDEFALSSQQKYQKAKKMRNFENEIVPIKIVDRKSEKVLSEDEFPRAETSLDGLAKLKPCFVSASEKGSVTAGNASGINDGAALVMLMKRKLAIKHNLIPLVRIVSWSQVGNEPMLMGVAPIESIKLAVSDKKYVYSNSNLNMCYFYYIIVEQSKLVYG